MKKPSKLFLISSWTISFFTFFMLFSKRIPLNIKVYSIGIGLFILIIQLMYVTNVFINWIIEGFKIQGEALREIMEIIKDVAHVAVVDPELVKELIEKKGSNLSGDSKKISEDLSVSKELVDKVNLLAKDITDLKPMRLHFQFLLWFIPVAIAIIAVIAGIVAWKH